MVIFINYLGFFENTNVYDIIHIKKLYAKHVNSLHFPVLEESNLGNLKIRN